MPCWVVADHKAEVASVEFEEVPVPLGGAVYKAVIVPLDGMPHVQWYQPHFPNWIVEHFAENGIDMCNVFSVQMPVAGQAVNGLLWQRLDTADGVLYFIPA